ncbi:MAG TPA: AsmA-like C-terminal region-containing protein [Bacteroidales bacterium]|nr:AsmA-like C-terminal region-containing protein [Bacteroidales bacterium]HSA43701.1 AsmA-like C-terminal region-containing protein [Bacteroidales bacterium]
MKTGILRNKAFKITGIILGALILLLITLPFVFQNKLVGVLKQSINENLTAVVDFKDHHLSLFRSFPNFSLELEQLSVAGTGAFSQDTLFRTESIDLTLDLFSVLFGSRYKISKIGLVNPRVKLIVSEEGRANWDIVKESADTVKEAAEEPSAFKLSIDKVRIRQGMLVYDDRSASMKAMLNGMDLSLKADMDGDLSHMWITAVISETGFTYAGIPYLNKIQTRIKSELKANLETMRFDFKDNEISLNELVFGLDGWFAMPGDDMEMDLAFAAEKAAFRQFLSLVPAIYSKDFASVETSGSLAFEGKVKGTYNDKTIPSFSIRLQVADAMFRYPALPAAVTNIGMDVSLANPDGDPDHTVIDIKKLHAALAGNPVDVTMLVSRPVSDPTLRGSIKARMNLADVGKVYPLSAEDQLNGIINTDIRLNGSLSAIEQKRYEAFQADGILTVSDMQYKGKDFPQGMQLKTLRLLFSPQHVDMPEADLKFGRSDLNASGKLFNILAYVLKGEQLEGSFESRSALIDLNEFTGGETGTTASDTSALSVIRVPANIRFNARTSVDRLLYENMDMRNVSGNLTIADEKLSLDRLSMQLLGGTMAVSGDYDSKPEQPEMNFSLDASRIDIPGAYKTFGTVQKLAPVAERCSGKVSMKVMLHGRLDHQMTPVYEKLFAKGSLIAENLEISDLPIIDKIAETLKMNTLKRLSVPNTRMELTIKEGKLEVQPFTYTVQGIKTTAGGWNALDQRIAYDVLMEIPRSMFGGQANTALDGLVKKAGSQGLKIDPGSTVVIAAKIGGTFMKPEVSADLKKSMQSAMEDIKEQISTQVQEKVKEEIREVKEDLSAKAAKIIADAESQAQKIRDEAAKTGEALISEAEKQGQALVNKAGNPIAKAAAKETSRQMVKTARDKAAKIRQEADGKAARIVEDARKEAEKIK